MNCAVISSQMTVQSSEEYLEDKQNSLFVKQWGIIMIYFLSVVSEPVEDCRSAFPCRGGETEALARLKHYFWDTVRLFLQFSKNDLKK